MITLSYIAIINMFYSKDVFIMTLFRQSEYEKMDIVKTIYDTTYDYEAKYDIIKSETVKSFKFAIIILIIDLILLTTYCLIAGKNDKEDEISLNFFDKIYIGIKTILVMSILVIHFTILFLGSHDKIYDVSVAYFIEFITMSITVTVVANYCASIVKLVRKKAFLRNIFFIDIFYKLVSTIKSIFAEINSSYKFNKMYKMKVIFVTYTLLAILSTADWVFLFTFLLYNIVILISILYVISKIERIKNGDYIEQDYKFKFNIFNYEIQSLSEIQQKITQSNINSEKAQNTKTELITNVSHDLRTPLTSIIAYVDLL